MAVKHYCDLCKEEITDNGDAVIIRIHKVNSQWEAYSTYITLDVHRACTAKFTGLLL